jgi:hypothetical protein
MSLPKFEDYKAPWEIDLKEGDEPTFDFEKGKKYLYGVLSDKEKAQKERDDVKAELSTVTTERDTLKSEKEAKAPEGETEVQRLTRERDEARENERKAREAKPKEGEKTAAELRLEVALDMGLTAVQAKRLQGNTKEELEADAKDLLDSFGASGETGDEDEDGGDGPRTRPTRQLRNPADPQNGKGGELDEDAIVDNYVANHAGFGV